MNETALFLFPGLLSALFYGLLDMLYILAARLFKQFRMLAWMHLMAAVVLLLVSACSQQGPSVALGLPLIVVTGIVLGGINAVGNLAAYKAYGHGPISLITFVISSYGLVPLVLAVWLLHEPFSLPQRLCATLIMLGLCLLTCGSSPESMGQLSLQNETDGRKRRWISLANWRVSRGLMWGLLALVCFGTEAFLTARTSVSLNITSLLLSSRLCSAVVLFVIAKQHHRERSLRATAASSFSHGFFIVAMACVDLAAVGLFVWGSHMKSIGVTSAVGMAYPAFALILGFVAFRERPKFGQWTGIACVGIGIMVLASVSS
jgi:drug/metabolite transporter (DMT)-like permease